MKSKKQVINISKKLFSCSMLFFACSNAWAIKTKPSLVLTSLNGKTLEFYETARINEPTWAQDNHTILIGNTERGSSFSMDYKVNINLGTVEPTLKTYNTFAPLVVAKSGNESPNDNKDLIFSAKVSPGYCAIFGENESFKGKWEVLDGKNSSEILISNFVNMKTFKSVAVYKKRITSMVLGAPVYTKQDCDPVKDIPILYDINGNKYPLTQMTDDQVKQIKDGNQVVVNDCYGDDGAYKLLNSDLKNTNKARVCAKNYILTHENSYHPPYDLTGLLPIVTNINLSYELTRTAIFEDKFQFLGSSSVENYYMAYRPYNQDTRNLQSPSGIQERKFSDINVFQGYSYNTHRTGGFTRNLTKLTAPRCYSVSLMTMNMLVGSVGYSTYPSGEKVFEFNYGLLIDTNDIQNIQPANAVSRSFKMQPSSSWQATLNSTGEYQYYNVKYDQKCEDDYQLTNPESAK